MLSSSCGICYWPADDGTIGVVIRLVATCGVHGDEVEGEWRCAIDVAVAAMRGTMLTPRLVRMLYLARRWCGSSSSIKYIADMSDIFESMQRLLNNAVRMKPSRVTVERC
jgi:hypothetical protein